MVSYQYQMLVALANFELGIGVISDEIQECIEPFNSRSRVAKNFKQLVKCEIRDESQLLEIWLDSNNKMNSAIKGISLFTKLIIEKLEEESESIPEKKELFDKIIVNKCLLKVVDVKEVRKLKLEKLEKMEEWDDSKILTNNVAEKFQEISIIEADKVIRDLFYNMENRGDLEEKAKDGILRVVEKYLIEKGVK
ncbi:hypothetical protein CLOBY_00380 [Clostridium saccharobutylicum]|uniref:hypothetical protein n=1 Tax=Clostridium saccharobutylicum TaxID=169679 RepID=UPI000983EE95|nr:hypothetical protein [Clostridium saccharobutylicum]AQS07989.1 hypothetical protein CLOBY_00380 [Clostridium saccharobutylicum]MBC2436965.1 hypothetical protein [Clostridium saccharobutylicum]NSB89317.1 hypothetical protein [Clostridium saccharobutylicum]NYC29693.1 hypothetical protein [Clostridium saccharobutylicum]OOM17320.1 hypothetical protein CLSAB_17450 [Clostridium saccharobutylicum]